MSLVAGNTYSVLVAYNQTTAGSYPYTVTLVFSGPGCTAINGHVCAVATSDLPLATITTRAAVDTGRAFGGSVLSRLGQLRGNNGIASQAANGLTSLNFSNFGSSGAGYAGPASNVEGISAGDSLLGEEHGLWIRGLGAFTNNRGDGSTPGFSRQTGGALVGSDLLIRDDLRVGVAIGYAYSNINGKQGTGNSIANSYHASVYAGWMSGPWFAAADLGLTWSRFENSRTMDIGSVSYAAQSKNDVLDTGTGVEVGYRFNVRGVAIEPSATLRYDRISANGYTETGADSFNLTVEDSTNNALRAGLGARASTVFTLNSGLQLEPDVNLRWERDLLDPGYQTTQSMNGGTSFVSNAANPGRDAVVLGTGIAAMLDDSLKLYAHYDTELRSRQTDHFITAGLRYAW